VIRIERASVIIGRHGADVLIDDPEVSRHHAQLDLHAARGVVRDLGSTNGVFVNDRKVSEAEIDNRGEFRVGGTKLMLILTEEESGA
jgi:pSer/pThr/pTyr-binding forkhead associated (FHA) protein